MTGTSFYNRNKTDVLFVPETSPLINQLKINMCDNKSVPLNGKREPRLIRGDVLLSNVRFYYMTFSNEIE